MQLCRLFKTGILMLFVVLTGCANNDHNLIAGDEAVGNQVQLSLPAQENIYMEYEEPAENNAYSMTPEVAEAFKGFLLNQNAFHGVQEAVPDMTSSDEHYNINCDDVPVIIRETNQFAVVDMDMDGVPEIVIPIASRLALVLRYSEDGIVHEYNLFGTGGLKQDGSFYISGGISFGIARLHFTDSGYEMTIEALREFCFSDDRDCYYIGEEEVTEEEFDAVIAAFDSREDAVLYYLTEENILTVFSNL